MPHMKRRATGFLILTILAVFFLLAALIILMTRPARADEGLPPGITCEMIREKVAEHGKLVALAWAIRQGYSSAQIHAARRCLK